jgi:hypothetical protein
MAPRPATVRAAPPARSAALARTAPNPAREGLLPTAWSLRLIPSDSVATRPPENPPRTTTQVVAELIQVPEVGLNMVGLTSREFRTKLRNGSPHPVLAHIDSHEELRGLPVVRGQSCQLPPAAGQQLGEASQRLRAAFQDITAALESRPESPRRDIVAPYRARLEEAGDPAQRASLLLQLLQCESDPLRELLIDLLARTPGPAAGRALVHRALFEPDTALRGQAVRSLKERPADEVRATLLDAFRHPWPAAADHAADALSALDDRAAVPGLLRLLDEPDPAAPFDDGTGMVSVREVVRVNHLQNCLLCHAPSLNATDPARSIVPVPGRSLTPSRGSPSYYGNRSAADSLFARFDVTYLRQDFSLMLDVANPGAWPKSQRFDFLVRTRPAREEDQKCPSDEGSYSQREAVLRALRRLTGQDFGDQPEDWRAGLRASRGSVREGVALR